MALYILKRLGLGLLTFVIIFVMIFVLVKMLPNPMVAIQPGTDNYAIEMARRKALGYDEPIMTQMWIFIKNAFQGDFGTSWHLYYNTPVNTIIAKQLPATMLINVYSILFSVPLGLGLGVLAALKKNKWPDQVISVGVMIFISVPSFVYAFILQYFFCFKLDWFPLRMLSMADAGGTYFSWPMFVSMLPAVFSLSFGTIAGLTRFTRAELTEVLTSDFMLLARSKGLTRTQATVRHAMRNAMVPILPSIIGEFIGILGGSYIIELIFSVPGIGATYINSINTRDYDVFLTLSMFYVAIGLVASIVIDLSYGFIDPRIVIGGGKD